MKKIVLMLSATILVAVEAMAYTTFAHQTIAKLAETHLTERAKSEVNAILKSDITKHSNWLDALSKNSKYAYTKAWQTFTLDANGKSTTVDENDGVVVLERAIEVLRNRHNEADSLVLASLRTVIQLVGDIHCIPNIRIDGNEATKGFTFIAWNNTKGRGEKRVPTTWSWLWNGYAYRHDVFSPHYYAKDIDIYLGHKKAEYEQGTPRSWVENVGEDVVRCLEVIYPDVVVKYEIVHRYEDIHNKCMAKAGYRLAALLNETLK